MIGTILRVRYELLELLRDGPLFALYSARDQVQVREVAVRVLKPPFSGEQPLVQKLREVVAKVASVQHSSIERLYEVDDHEGTPFIVGEFPKGAPLSERLQKLGTFSAAVAGSTAISICEGLDALHQAGVVHGDVGAHNVTLTVEGVARLQLPGVWEAYSASQTAGAMVLGSMAPYLAPEVSAGAMPSPASDVYSLGVLIFELLVGRPPYIADTPVALAMKHGTAPTPSARFFNTTVPMVLDEIVKKAMSKDPLARYPTASAMLADLRILQDAVRFGKALTWPLRPTEAAPTPIPDNPAPVSAPFRVEAKPARQYNPVYDDEPEKGDVPGWLKTSIIFFSAILISMIGIWLVFNLNRAKEITVPNLVKLRQDEAEAELRQNGIKLSVLREQPSEKFPAGTILQSDPPANEKIREGGEVRIVVSSGSRFVEVPDVRGMTRDEAIRMLGKVRLNLDDRWREVPGGDIPAGQIVAQRPEKGMRVERSTRIRVDVSSGARSVRPEPQNDERYAYTLKIRTTGVQEPVTVRVEMLDARSKFTVHEAVHLPDEEFTVVTEGIGREAIFTIYYNGTQVKQITQNADSGGRN
ncbi:MAG: PASTA domain-containing protein [Fimbriimonadaceae bacterium]